MNNKKNSIQKTLCILAHICRQKNGIRPSELARYFNTSSPTIYHYLKNMITEGFIFKDQVSGRFRATYRIVELAAVVLGNNEISELTYSILCELSEDVKSTIHLALREGDLGVCVSKVGNSETIPSITRVGMSFELYPTALGKAILAFLSNEELLEYLHKTELIPYTKNTITDKASLIEELDRTRSRGYSIDMEEHRLGLRALGVPIFDYTDKVIGALSLMPTVNMDDKEEIEHILQRVHKASLDISKKLGNRHSFECDTSVKEKNQIVLRA